MAVWGGGGGNRAGGPPAGSNGATSPHRSACGPWGRSPPRPTRRGGRARRRACLRSRRGAKVLREGLAPLPSLQLYVPAIDTLEEICGWLGTFRERLRVAHTDERADVAAVVLELEARYQTRRAELS